MSQPRPAAFLQPVVGEHAFPIALLRRRPIGGQLGASETGGRRDVEFGRAANADGADMAASEQPDAELAGRSWTGRQVILPIAKLRAEVELLDRRRETRRGVKLARAVGALHEMDFGVVRKERLAYVKRRIQRCAHLA